VLVTTTRQRTDNGVEFSELARRFEYVWHVTYAGAWPSIREWGFWPAVDVLQHDGHGDRVGIFRAGSLPVVLDDGPKVTVRDQIRARRDVSGSLEGVDEEGWWSLINARVYFFAREDHAEVLRDKYVNRGEPQEVIKLRTRALEDRAAAIEVTTANAGVFPRKVGRNRGLTTFVSLSDFDATDATRIREITVVGQVRVADAGVISVIRHEAGVSARRVFP
jgi:hypothetical protein